MKTVKKMASEKAAYWSLNANCGITLHQAMVDVIVKDGDGYEFYVPKPFSQGDYSHFLTKFGGNRVILLRLGEWSNTRLMKAEQDGTICIYKPMDEDDAALQNMWLQQVGVPWRVAYNVDGGKWHLTDADGLTAADFPTTGQLPHIKVYAVHSEPADTAKASLAFYNCYVCGMKLNEADHQPALYKAGYWAHYDTGSDYIAPCHHYCCQDEWKLADTEGPIL